MLDLEYLFVCFNCPDIIWQSSQFEKEAVATPGSAIAGANRGELIAAIRNRFRPSTSSATQFHLVTVFMKSILVWILCALAKDLGRRISES